MGWIRYKTELQLKVNIHMLCLAAIMGEIFAPPEQLQPGHPEKAIIVSPMLN